MLIGFFGFSGGTSFAHYVGNYFYDLFIVASRLPNRGRAGQEGLDVP